MGDHVLSHAGTVVALAGGALATAAALGRRPRIAVTVLVVTGFAAFLVQDRPALFTTIDGVVDQDAPPEVRVAHDPATDREPGQE